MAERFRMLLGAALCAAAFEAQALAIGGSRGEPIVGQPLELNFDVSLDAGADANSSCVSAELFYGDSRVDPSRVRVTARPSASTTQVSVQVASAVVVNEPVVSVVLHAGCGTAMSRRFVLLSSSPVEAVAPVAPMGRALASGAPTTVPAEPMVTRLPGLDMGAAVSGPRRIASVTRPPVNDLRARPQAVPRKAKTPSAFASGPVREVDAVRGGGARLELQSASDWLQEQVLPLHSSDSMATPSLTVTPEQRAAAAALWRSLNSADGAAPAEADDASQQKLAALENQVKLLQNGARMARGRESDLQGQLGEAQRDRDTAWFIVWPLAVLVLLALAAGAFLWRRGRRAGTPRAAWWKPGQQDDFGADTDTAFAEGFVDTRPAPQEFPFGAEGAALRVPESPVAFVDTMPAPAPTFVSSQMPEEESMVAPTSAEAAMRAARELRNGSANELADVQQNADFFASLGQYDQAIELLQEYIASHPGTSPIAYLDLLKLFHTLSLTDPYRKLRTDFNAVFNAEVPPFASFLKPSRDLTAYSDVMQRISDVWEQPGILDLIESLLVRHAGEGAHPPFQLEAYRDLLLLYEIAKIEHGSEGERLAVPPHLERPAAAPTTVAAPVAAAAAAPVAAAPSPETRTPLDFTIEPEPLQAAPVYMPPPSLPEIGNLGMSLDFAPPPSELVHPPHPSLDDISLPDVELPARTLGVAPEDDPHLIDFDMFDVAVQPTDKKPKP